MATTTKRPTRRPAPTQKAVVAALLDRHGLTFAQQSGIKLADRPGPLYQLLVLATLLSARISADVAVAAARALFADGYRSPRAMRTASWQDRVDALGKGHYRRYDERTATMLGKGADLVLERWKGDLRRMRAEASGDVNRLRKFLTETPGIGPTGADIFLREVQALWPEFAPYADKRMLAGAEKLHLPASTRSLAGMVGRDDLPRLAAALVRVSRSAKAADAVRTAAES